MDYHTQDRFKLYYHIKNNFFLPPITFITKSRNLHKSEKHSEKISFSQNKPTIEVSLVLKEIGTYEIRLDEIQVSDFFYIFKFKRKFSFVTQVNVYPLPLRVQNRDIFTEIIHESDVQVYEKGDDYTEIFGFHEYRDTEPLKHVHPALSAKFDEYIIKEGSDTQRKVYIYPMKEAKKFFHLENDLKKIYYMFQIIVLDKNDFFIVRHLNHEIPIYNHYDLYSFMNQIYKEFLP